MEKVALRKLTMIRLVKRVSNQGRESSALHQTSNTQIRGFGSPTLNTQQELEI